MFKQFLLLSVLVAITYAAQVSASTPKNALGAIAVSPDGKMVLAAGDNRVLYVLDAGDLSVQKSIWIGVNPRTIHYSKDGSSFVIHDTTGDLTFYRTETWESFAEYGDANSITVADGANLLFAAGQSKGRNEEATTPIYGYDLTTAAQTLAVSTKGRVLSVGALTDASRLFALTKAAKSESENKEKPPASLKKIAKAQFVQEHDEKVSELITFDDKGAELGRYETWYSTSSHVDLLALGESIFAITYNNVNADLDRTGKQTSVFKLGNSYNYGIGYSIQSGWLASGGLAAGTIMNLNDRSTKTFSIAKIGGWPEYFEGFAVAGDGTVYGGTTAYRLIKINPDGSIAKAVPVY